MPDYTILTDNELLTLLQGDDRGSFTELYNRYWKRLLAIAYNHSRNQDTAEEIVQEIFVSLWDRRSIVRIDCVAAYLATAVKFSVFKHLARHKRHTEIAQAHCLTFAADLDEQQIDAKFLNEYILGLVEQLPEKCRLVFKYSRIEHLTIPEIAAKAGIAEKTVEAHLTKGLKFIRLNLKDSGILSLILLAGSHLK